MREPLAKIVNEAIVISKNKKEYLDMIRRLVPLNEQICKLLDDYKYSYEYFDDVDSPSSCLFVNLGSYEEGLFYIKYTFNLEISKIKEVRKDMFMFQVNDCDPDNTAGGFLAGHDCEPLTLTHDRFYKELNVILDSYTELLNYNDLHEVICDLEFVEPSMKFFSAQPNVDLILFHDFFCNIEDDEEGIWEIVKDN